MMKPNDKAIDAAILAIKENGPYYAGSKIRESMAKHLAEVALPPAYAAQFKSEDYAGLVKELRACDGSIFDEAADAIEALLAERDKLKATSDAHVKGWMHQSDKATAAIKERDALAKERDALLARFAPVEDDSRHLTAEEQKVFHSALRRSAKIKKPVEDEALVEIVGRTLRAEVFDPDVLKVYGDLWAYDEQRKILKQARAAIAAIRPHIEAAEREKCAKIAELHSYPMKTVAGTGYNNVAKEIAAAIRSGK